jgi:glycerol-3-phosphate cytidylyltransferase
MMSKVLVVGVFDLFHFGHLRMLNRAAKLGDYLIVAVQEDEYVARFKPNENAFPLYSTEERIEMIRALRCVDEVTTYKVIADDIKKFDFDVFVQGADQTHSGFVTAIDWCHTKGREVVQLPRTEGISSTYLKNLMCDFSPSN